MCAVSQSLTTPARLVVARVLPSGLNSSATTSPLCPESVARSRPSSRLQTFASDGRRGRGFFAGGLACGAGLPAGPCPAGPAARRGRLALRSGLGAGTDSGAQNSWRNGDCALWRGTGRPAGRGRRGEVAAGGLTRTPAASQRPSGEIPMQRTRNSSPPSVNRTRPRPMSQILIVPSPPRVASALPLSKTARLRTISACPRNVARSWPADEAVARTKARLSGVTSQTSIPRSPAV